MQGASTIVWACVADELNGKSGAYLEVCLSMLAYLLSCLSL